MHNYQIKEFTPKSGQNGTHSFYVEAKPFQTLDNQRIAEKIHARNGIIAPGTAKLVLETLSDLMLEEIAEGSALALQNGKNDTIVKFLAKAEYSVTDKDVEERTTERHKKDASVAIRKVATADDIVAQDINWRVAAQVGVNFSKEAAAAIRKAGTKRVGEVEKTETPAEDSGQQPGVLE